MFNVCRIRTPPLTQPVTAQTAREILDEQSFEFTLCHAATLRHYALAVLTPDIYVRFPELARWWPSQLVLGWNVDRPGLYAAPVVICSMTAGA